MGYIYTFLYIFSGRAGDEEAAAAAAANAWGLGGEEGEGEGRKEYVCRDGWTRRSDLWCVLVQGIKTHEQLRKEKKRKKRSCKMGPTFFFFESVCVSVSASVCVCVCVCRMSVYV